MRLYHSPTSPYVRKVVVTALLTKTFDDIQLVPASLTPLVPSAEVQRVNPLGKIPTLVLDGGTALFDSPVHAQLASWYQAFSAEWFMQQTQPPAEQRA